MKTTRHVLALMAHPDDIEAVCAGTLTRLWQKGYRIHLATMSSGECGSTVYSPQELARIRVRENTAAARLIGATYDSLGCPDCLVCYGAATIERAVEVIRRYQPFLVITHSPRCYHLDHEETAKIVRAACFNASIPNFSTRAADPAPPSGGVPYLYYADAMEQKDQFGDPVVPQFYVDITRVMPTKLKMLRCHASQRSWLRKQHHIDAYLAEMEARSARRGRDVGVRYAECYRQHLGHAFPQDNVLGRLLGALQKG